MLPVRQKFEAPQVQDVGAATREALEPLRGRITSGMRVALTAGRATRVVLKLSKRNAREVRRALARGARLTANVTLAVHDAAGNGSARRLRLKLRR